MPITLVTGATGYIGGRLVPRLLAEGHAVRVLVRGADSIKGRSWADEVEIVRGDLLDAETLRPALDGVGTAYYLVHSMTAGEGFEERDREAARNFVAACRHGREADGDLPHVVYLGGLQPAGDATSAHLASRAETGAVLEEGLPGRVTEFRAGPIIGSGSASFEMVRYLTERLPVMICPSWVDTVVTPVAIRDVLAYLLAAGAEGGPGPAGTVDIGATPRSFRDMMLGLAEARGLRRRIIRVPFVAAGLAARWVSLVTPIPLDLAKPLVKGTTRDLIADTAKARRLFPDIEPLPYLRAVELAVERHQRRRRRDPLERRRHGARESHRRRGSRVPDRGPRGRLPRPADADHPGRAQGGVRRRLPHRRRPRLPRLGLGVEAARPDGRRDRRPGPAPRAARPRPDPRGRGAGLLARREPGRTRRGRRPLGQARGR